MNYTGSTNEQEAKRDRLHKLAIARTVSVFDRSGNFDRTSDKQRRDEQGRNSRYEQLASWRSGQYLKVVRKALKNIETKKDPKSTQERLIRSRLADNTNSAAIGGFMVIARILSFAPEAYGRYLTANGLDTDTLSVQALRAILINKASLEHTASCLAGMGSMRNSMWEAYLHVDRTTFRLPRNPLLGCPFVIASADAEETPHLQINRVNENYVKTVEEDERDATVPDEKACPARKVLLPTIWTTLVEDCVQSSELFKPDLAALGNNR